MGNVKTENNKLQTVLKYPGSKWRLANWIISYFPNHNNYVEPFFGSGAVLFNKQPAKNEIANDIDCNVVNLFKVIREHGLELAQLIEMTPLSREEHCNSYIALESDTNIEQARKYLVRIWQGFGGKGNGKTAWAHSRNGDVFRPRYWSRVPNRILDIVERLKQVQFENCDALELIERCNHPDTLLYVDPPYLLSTRSSRHYKHEFATEKKHLELLQLLKNHKGYSIISTYDSDLYNTELSNWAKYSERVATNAGGSRIETIYVSPNCRVQNSLF